MVHIKSKKKKKEWSSHLLKAYFCSDSQKNAAPLHLLALFLPSLSPNHRLCLFTAGILVSVNRSIFSFC